MKKIILLIVFLFAVYINVFGQKYFNRLYLGPYCTFARMCIFDDTSNIALGYFLTSTNRVLYLNKMNEKGDTVWTKLYGTTPHVYNPDMILKIEQERFLVVMDIQDTIDSDTDIALAMFDANGTELWNKRYFVNGTDVVWCAKITKDKGYILAGASDSYGTGARYFYLVKTDSLGNKEWFKTYGGGVDDVCGSVALTDDGGYILTGYSYTSSADYDVAVVKTDSLGNIQWRRTYGTNNSDYGGQIIQMKDGNYMFVLNTDYISRTTANLYKIDRQGIVIWQKQYPYDKFTDFELPIIENIDETLVTGGIIKDTATNGHAINWLIKIDRNGDTLWTRKYYTRTDRPQYMYDIKATADSGYVMCGSGIDSTDNLQKAWVVKVDCMGADSVHYYFPTSSCGTTGWGVGIKEEVEANANGDEFSIYPNPTNKELKIENGELKIEEVRVYNVLGELVYSISSPSGRSGGASIDVSSLRAGIYFVQVRFLDVSTGSTQVKSTKFVKE